MEAPIKRSPRTGISPPPESMAAEASSMPDDGLSVAVKRFASLFGTKGQKDLRQTSQVTQMFAQSTSSNDVVLIVPSLELKLDGDENRDGSGRNSVLPEVGQRANLPCGDAGSSSFETLSQALQQTAQPTTTTSMEQQQHPAMEASVINMAAPMESFISMEQKGADSIGQPTCWTRSTVCYAAHAVASNLSDSFALLVNSRLRAWTLLLLKHSLATPPTSDDSSPARSRLLNMLSAKISVQGMAETTYRTLPLPETAAGAKPKNADVILPLLFEVVLYLQVQEKEEAVTLRAPGTVAASFANGTAAEGLKQIILHVDTGVLLKSMVDQARIVVLKAVATATNTPVSDLPNLAGKREGKKEKPAPATTEVLGSFRSALMLPRSGNDQRLQKARASALLLNRALHGKQPKKPPPSLGIRKARSVAVKWDNPGPTPRLNSTLAPTPSKKRSDAAALLTSYKSFGRPHAGDFGSGPRNATFNDYGGRVGTGRWGRDGRLAAHPTPFMEAAVDPTTGDLKGGSMDRNATFDTRSLSSLRKNFLDTGPLISTSSSSAAAGAALLWAGRTESSPPSHSSLGGQAFRHSPSAPNLPRTATMMEKSLIENISSK